MRKYVLLLMILVCVVIGFDVKVVHAELEDAYLNKIVSVIVDYDYVYDRFELGYVNDDSIPDVLVSTGDSHASGVEIYLLKDNEVYKVTTSEGYSSFGDWGVHMEYIPYENTIKSEAMGYGVLHTGFYKIEGSYANALCNLICDNHSEDTEWYKNDVQVTENEYNAAMNKYYNNGENYVSISSYEKLTDLNEESLRAALMKYWPSDEGNMAEAKKEVLVTAEENPVKKQDKETTRSTVNWILPVLLVVMLLETIVLVVIIKRKKGNIKSNNRKKLDNYRSERYNKPKREEL